MCKSDNCLWSSHYPFYRATLKVEYHRMPPSWHFWKRALHRTPRSDNCANIHCVERRIAVVTWSHKNMLGHMTRWIGEALRSGKTWYDGLYCLPVLLFRGGGGGCILFVLHCCVCKCLTLCFPLQYTFPALHTFDLFLRCFGFALKESK
jgi:hypothetical protein